MALTRIKTESPDKVLKAADYNEGQLARVAHVNEIVDQLSALAKAIPALTGTGTNTDRLLAIESKFNALLVALA